jgi:D-tyrosyl-tRNA(Tyr) deacylase
MKVVIQRSKNSKVTIDGKINGQIDHGFVLLSSFTEGDTKELVDKMIDKIINLRIFEDEEEKMNLSLLDVKGSILNISQFTLYADCSKGRRPSFFNAMNPSDATKLYDYMNQKLRETGINTQTGIFGADMKVEIYNDGPVTIILDSKEIF